MIVGVCGYGYSGSGAVLDLLQEYEDVSYLDSFECSFIHNVDGLYDLERALDPLNPWGTSDIAIQRFLNFAKNAKKYNKKTNGEFYKISCDFIRDICNCQWKGFSIWDLTRKGTFSSILWATSFLSTRWIARIFGIYLKCYPNRDMFYAMTDDDFLEKEKKYVNSVLELLGCDMSKTVVLDQVFRSNHPEIYFKYFENVKAIVVDRDPRDILAIAKKQQPSEARFMPSDDVTEFIKYYRMIRGNNSSSDQILHIQFEDLIFNYEECVKKIESFTGLHNHVLKMKYFKPYISKKNTKLFDQYLDIQSDIKKIEQNLEEYLYDFKKEK